MKTARREVNQGVNLQPCMASVMEVLGQECVSPSELMFSCNQRASKHKIFFLRVHIFVLASLWSSAPMRPTGEAFQGFFWNSHSRKLLYCLALLSLDRCNWYLESEGRVLPPISFKTYIQTQEFLHGSIESEEC